MLYYRVPSTDMVTMESSSLLRIVSPILQALVALAVRILLRLFLLRQMSLAVSDDFSHVINVICNSVIKIGLLTLKDDVSTKQRTGCHATCPCENLT